MLESVLHFFIIEKRNFICSTKWLEKYDWSSFCKVINISYWLLILFVNEVKWVNIFESNHLLVSLQYIFKEIPHCLFFIFKAMHFMFGAFLHFFAWLTSQMLFTSLLCVEGIWVTGALLVSRFIRWGVHSWMRAEASEVTQGGATWKSWYLSLASHLL